MKKSLILIPLLLTSSGCTTLFSSVYDKVGDAVSKYCDKESYSQRVVYYEEINARLDREGHHIAVMCAGDPEAQGSLPE